MDLDVKQIELVDLCDDGDEEPKVFSYNLFHSMKWILFSKFWQIYKFIQETQKSYPKDLLLHHQQQSSK